MSIGIIVTAAGTGSRFGHPDGKQFVVIKGKPLLIHSCLTLSQALPYQQFIITIEESKIEQAQALLSQFNLPKNIQVIAGGATRQESVKKAFDQLKNIDTVFIHDGARPSLTTDLIQRLQQAATKHPAVIPGIPTIDTIKLVNKNLIVQQTLPRNLLYQVQTPQVFSYEILQKAYQLTNTDITDEASLVEKAGFPVQIIPGELKNIKITYPEDLKYL